MRLFDPNIFDPEIFDTGTVTEILSTIEEIRMSDSTIRASIKALMQTVPGIGVVHDYDRWTVDSAALVALFKTDPTDKTAPLHGWEITRDAVQLAWLSGNRYKATHSYVIRGYYALKDAVASEKLFNLIVDALVQAFIDHKLPNVEFHPVPAVTKIAPWIFAGVMCHHAELRIQTTELVQITEESIDLLKHHIALYLAPEQTIVENAVPDETADITL